jgi:transposase
VFLGIFRADEESASGPSSANFNGVTKDRRLCEEVKYDLAHRWYCRLSLAEDIPDHSSLSRIRDRFGEEVFEAVFRRIVAQCQQKGLD